MWDYRGGGGGPPQDLRLKGRPFLVLACLQTVGNSFALGQDYPEGYNTNYDDDGWDSDPYGTGDEGEVEIWTFLGKNLGFWIAYMLVVSIACFIPGCMLCVYVFAICQNKDWEVPFDVWTGFECVFCCQSFDKDDEGKEKWKAHREKCFREHEEIFNAWRSPYNRRCGKCDVTQLRLVPASGDSAAFSSRRVTSQRRFRCAAEECPYKYLRTTGANRLMCYKCDYNECRTCLRKEMGIYVKPGSGSV